MDDLSPRIGWRTVRAGILARRGDLGEADRLSAEALAMVEQTDWSTDHADTLMARAEVLSACLESSAAREAMLTALALHEAKGNVVGAERVRDRLARAQVGVRGSTQPGGGS